MGWCLSKERVVEGREGEGPEREVGKGEGKGKVNLIHVPECSWKWLNLLEILMDFSKFCSVVWRKSLRFREQTLETFKTEEWGSLKRGKDSLVSLHFSWLSGPSPALQIALCFSLQNPETEWLSQGTISKWNLNIKMLRLERLGGRVAEN